VPAPRRANALADARAVAVEALLRIEEGSYANLVLPAILGRSALSAQDRRFVTELVYGTTRMRRACDWLVDRYITRPPDDTTRAVLRLGAYQLAFLSTPPHAAVNATVAVAPGRTRGLVNAVLRRVAAAPAVWPNEGTRLSYPDWIIDRLVADLGLEDATRALEVMNEAPSVTTRADGYTQDLASQWVVDAVGAPSRARVADLCAAPGGKATGIAASGAFVVAGDIRPARAGLVAANVESVGASSVAVIAADGTRPPFAADTFDIVVVDAPCTGLGVLRRRPDARWRIQPGAVEDLALLQRQLLTAAAALVRPGGTVVYSVCTMTAAETLDIDTWAMASLPGFDALPAPEAPWAPAGRGARLLPQAADTDAMFILKLVRSR
jgi:16S rRNA (cytosine967-C5)-methyltransferase